MEHVDKAKSSHLITTSNELLVKATWPRLNINEQRIVLYMLALVKKNDADFQTYRISVRELTNILGLKRKDIYDEFDKATDGLMTKIIRWFDPKYNDLIKVTWCSSARLAKGRGFVEVVFDPRLKPFLLALRGNFTSYELKAVIKLKNHYSLRIYQLLKYHQGLSRVDGRKSVTYKIYWLRDYLGLRNGEYKLFGHFKSGVIMTAKKDIEQKTDLKFSFSHVKEGRKVVALEFFWSRNPKYDQYELPFFSNTDEEYITEVSETSIDVNETVKRVMKFGLSREDAEEVILVHKSSKVVEEKLDELVMRFKEGNIDNLVAYSYRTLLGRLPKRGQIIGRADIEVELEQEAERMRIEQEQQRIRELEQAKYDTAFDNLMREMKDAWNKTLKQKIRELTEEEMETYSEQFQSFREMLEKNGRSAQEIKTAFDAHILRRVEEKEGGFMSFSGKKGVEVSEDSDGNRVIIINDEMVPERLKEIIDEIEALDGVKFDRKQRNNDST